MTPTPSDVTVTEEMIEAGVATVAGMDHTIGKFRGIVDFDVLRRDLEGTLDDAAAAIAAIRLGEVSGGGYSGRNHPFALTRCS